ncbi:MAG: hypothetical protein Q7S04_02325 [Candidatus Moranbacteria bacterium]|nr:hypothetical protein [Candidatus Moranbacteria bacterium]
MASKEFDILKAIQAGAKTGSEELEGQLGIGGKDKKKYSPKSRKSARAAVTSEIAPGIPVTPVVVEPMSASADVIVPKKLRGRRRQGGGDKGKKSESITISSAMQAPALPNVVVAPDSEAAKLNRVSPIDLSEVKNGKDFQFADKDGSDFIVRADNETPGHYLLLSGDGKRVLGSFGEGHIRGIIEDERVEAVVEPVASASMEPVAMAEPELTVEPAMATIPKAVIPDAITKPFISTPEVEASLNAGLNALERGETLRFVGKTGDIYRVSKRDSVHYNLTQPDGRIDAVNEIYLREQMEGNWTRLENEEPELPKGTTPENPSVSPTEREKLEQKIAALKKEVEDLRKEYVKADYEETNAWARVRKFFGKNLKGLGERDWQEKQYNKKDGNSDGVYMQALYQNKLVDLKNAELSLIKERAAAGDGWKKEMGDMIKYFGVDEVTKLIDARTQYRAENQNFPTKILDAFGALGREYNKLSMKQKLAITAVCAAGTIGLTLSGGTAAGAMAGLIMGGKRFFATAGLTVGTEALLDSSRTRMRSKEMEEEMKTLEKEMSEKGFAHLEAVIKNKALSIDDELQKAKLTKLLHKAGALTVGLAVGSGWLTQVVMDHFGGHEAVDWVKEHAKNLMGDYTVIHPKAEFAAKMPIDLDLDSDARDSAMAAASQAPVMSGGVPDPGLELDSDARDSAYLAADKGSASPGSAFITGNESELDMRDSAQIAAGQAETVPGNLSGTGDGSELDMRDSAQAVVEQAKESPSSAFITGNESELDMRADNPLASETGNGSELDMRDSVQIAAATAAEARPSIINEFINQDITVKKGDSVWKIAGRLAKELGIDEKSPQGTRFINALKNQYGDVLLKEGSVINLADSGIDKEFVENAYADATTLSPEKMASIAANDVKLREFAAAHPDVTLTDGKVDDILHGNGADPAGKTNLGWEHGDDETINYNDHTVRETPSEENMDDLVSDSSSDTQAESSGAAASENETVIVTRDEGSVKSADIEYERDIRLGKAYDINVYKEYFVQNPEAFGAYKKLGEGYLGFISQGDASAMRSLGGKTFRELGNIVSDPLGRFVALAREVYGSKLGLPGPKEKVYEYVARMAMIGMEHPEGKLIRIPQSI